MNENALIALADAKAHIGIASADTTHDALLTTLIAEVSGFIDVYTGRTLRKQTGVILEAVGAGTSVLVLPEYPIAAVTLVTDENGNTIDSTVYTLKGSVGELKNRNSVWEAGTTYSVTATCGYTTAGQVTEGTTSDVPYALRLACAKLVAKAFERRHAEGTTNASAGQTSVGFQRDLDVEVQSTLDALRKYHV